MFAAVVNYQMEKHILGESRVWSSIGAPSWIGFWVPCERRRREKVKRSSLLDDEGGRRELVPVLEVEALL